MLWHPEVISFQKLISKTAIQMIIAAVFHSNYNIPYMYLCRDFVQEILKYVLKCDIAHAITGTQIEKISNGILDAAAS